MILGIDASTSATGYSIFDNGKLIDYGCIYCDNIDLYERIFYMTKEIKKILEQYNEIDQIAMEEVLPEKSGNRSNPRVYKALMYLQASISFLIYKEYPSISITFLIPGHWRKICGIKTSSKIKREELKKEDIQFVLDEFNLKVTDDEADAIGVAFAYIQEQEDNAW